MAAAKQVAAVLLALLASTIVHASNEASSSFDFSRPSHTHAASRPYRRHLTQQGSPLPPGIYNLSPSPERQGGDESPPLASPSPSPFPSPSPDRQGGDESPLPSPSPSASPSPSPSASPAPSPAPGPTCSGVAYDGYLSNCGLQFDATVVDGLVKAVTVVSGQFDTNMTASQLGAGYMTPAPSSTPLTAVPDGQSIPYCYDMVTRLPELLPLATTAPTDCSKPVVVDIASTVLQYGIKNNVAGFSEDAFKTALNISSAIDIGHYDALAAAQSTGAATKAQGVEILKTYSNLRTMAQLFTQASVRDRAALAQMAKQVFVALAQYIADGGASQPETRRLLTAGTRLDLTSAQEVQAAMTTLQTVVQQAVANGDLDAAQVEQIVDPAIQQAISRAIATINSIAMSATSLEDIQKAIQVAITTLSTNIQQLIATGDLATFNAQTSAASLQQAVNQATLAGGSVTPAGQEGSGSSNKGKLIGGLVGGLVGGFLVIAAIVGFIVYRRKRRAAAAAPAAQ